MTSEWSLSGRQTMKIERALQNDYVGKLGLTEYEAKFLIHLSMSGLKDEPAMAAAWFPFQGFKDFCDSHRIPYKLGLRSKAGLIDKGFLYDLEHSYVVNSGTKDERKYGDLQFMPGRGAARGAIRYRAAPGFGCPQFVVDALYEYNLACAEGGLVQVPRFIVRSASEIQVLRLEAMQPKQRSYFQHHIFREVPVSRAN